MNDIKALLERLGSLQITEEASNKYEQTDIEMLVAPVPDAAAISKNIQAGTPKNIVPDPRWFDGD